VQQSQLSFLFDEIICVVTTAVAFVAFINEQYCFEQFASFKDLLFTGNHKAEND